MPLVMHSSNHSPCLSCSDASEAHKHTAIHNHNQKLGHRNTDAEKHTSTYRQTRESQTWHTSDLTRRDAADRRKPFPWRRRGPGQSAGAALAAGMARRRQWRRGLTDRPLTRHSTFGGNAGVAGSPPCSPCRAVLSEPCSPPRAVLSSPCRVVLSVPCSPPRAVLPVPCRSLPGPLSADAQSRLGGSPGHTSARGSTWCRLSFDLDLTVIAFSQPRPNPASFRS